MKTRMMKNVKNIDDYIASYPKNVQNILKDIRKNIRKLAPQSEEAIRYGIPTIRLNGNMVHFAAYEKHIGFYPGSKAIKKFKKELSEYDTAKGTVRFYLDKKIPLNLINKIVKYRVKENLKKD